LETPFLFERRGKREDVDLELVFRRLCDGANYRGRMPRFSIEFFDKKANLTGLQIADLSRNFVACRRTTGLVGA